MKRFLMPFFLFTVLIPLKGFTQSDNYDFTETPTERFERNQEEIQRSMTGYSDESSSSHNSKSHVKSSSTVKKDKSSSNKSKKTIAINRKPEAAHKPVSKTVAKSTQKSANTEEKDLKATVELIEKLKARITELEKIKSTKNKSNVNDTERADPKKEVLIDSSEVERSAPITISK